VSWTLGDPWRASFLGLAYSLGLGIPFLLVALGFGWATKTIGFLRRHIRIVNIIGGVLLIALGVLMVSGLWTDLMSRLTAVMGSVQLPLRFPRSQEGCCDVFRPAPPVRPHRRRQRCHHPAAPRLRRLVALGMASADLDAHRDRAAARARDRRDPRLDLPAADGRPQ